jgi:glycosyltransferase involved in cell wall biosynthesis
MNALFFWEKVGGLTLAHKCNPYGPLLALSMKKQGIQFELGDYEFEKEYLEKKRKTTDVLHFNWIRHFYLADDLQTAIKRLNQFAENLHFARSLNYRLIWTLHNFYPHERKFHDLDHLAPLIMCDNADHVIAHCNYSANLARKYFYRTENLHVIPHGNYIDAYPNTISKSEARQQLNIPDNAFTYVFSGNARPYKGIDRLIQAFNTLTDPDAHLLLMMRSSVFPEYTQELLNIAADNPNIHAFTSSFFTPEEMQTYLNAADVAVLPFVDVLTSGSAILALSFGKPLVLPNIGCMPELINKTQGILFDPSDPNGLQKSLAKVREYNLVDAERAAFARAQELNWDTIAQQLATLYKA